MGREKHYTTWRALQTFAKNAGWLILSRFLRTLFLFLVHKTTPGFGMIFWDANPIFWIGIFSFKKKGVGISRLQRYCASIKLGKYCYTASLAFSFSRKNDAEPIGRSRLEEQIFQERCCHYRYISFSTAPPGILSISCGEAGFFCRCGA